MSKCRLRWEFHAKVEDKAILHVNDSLFDSNRDGESAKQSREFVEGLRGLAAKMGADPEDVNLIGAGGLLPDPLPARDKELVDSLASVFGVRQVAVRPYCIAVERSMVFSWEEITARVQAILVSWIGANPENVEVQEPIRCNCEHD